MSQVIEVQNDAELQEHLQSGKVLVDFYATWCGPCKMLSPHVEALAEEREDIKVIKFDIDKSSDFVSSISVMSVPTMMLFNNGEQVDKKIGFLPKDAISAWVDENN